MNFVDWVATKMEILAAVAVGTLWILGLLGLVLPILPGPTLIMISAWVCKLLAPASLEWHWVFIATAIWATGSVVDFLASLIGAKVMGSTKWGLLGAMVGALLGLFFLPFGLILGPLVGAFAGELLLARRNAFHSGKAGLGAGLGFVIGKFVQVLTALAMISVILWGVIGNSAAGGRANTVGQSVIQNQMTTGTHTNSANQSQDFDDSSASRRNIEAAVRGIPATVVQSPSFNVDPYATEQSAVTSLPHPDVVQGPSRD